MMVDFYNCDSDGKLFYWHSYHIVIYLHKKHRKLVMKANFFIDSYKKREREKKRHDLSYLRWLRDSVSLMVLHILHLWKSISNKNNKKQLSSDINFMWSLKNIPYCSFPKITDILLYFDMFDTHLYTISKHQN